MDRQTQRLLEIAKRKNEITTLISTANEEELNALEVEIRALNEETVTLRREIATAQAAEVVQTRTLEGVEEEIDAAATLEYRNAFRQYVMTGNDRNIRELRGADTTTTTTDVSAIIPTTVSNLVIQELASYGEILSLITFANYKGGYNIPIAGTKPTAQWVSEGNTADRKKQEIKGNVQFSYYKLQIQISITLLAATVSLEAWERTVAANISEAIAIALEDAVISGEGGENDQPLGILNDLDEGAAEGRIPQSAQHNFAIADATYQGWSTKLIGNMPLAYRKKNNTIVVNPLTWDKYMAGMMDDLGQPVGRVNYGINGEEVLRFFGKRVVLSEQVPDLDSATAGEAVALYLDFKNYIINTNLALQLRVYIDEKTDEIVRKATVIADGKMADVNGVVVLKKE